MPKIARNTGLDALRGLAVVLMVAQHLGVWLASWRGEQGFWFHSLLALNALGGGAAPLFLVLTGFGAAEGRSSDRQWLGRALGLAVFAYALNFATPSWFSWGSFYVLHTIAAFWLCVPFLRRSTASVSLALGLLVVATSYVTALTLGTPPSLDNARMNDLSLPGGALRLAFAEGHFPLLPWLALPLWGFWAARLEARGDGQRARRAAVTSVGVGLTLCVLGLWRPSWVWKWHLVRAVRFSFYPATPAFIFTLGGLAVVAACAARSWGTRGRPGEASLWVPLGRLSLTILFVHVIVFRQLAGMTGLTYRLSAAPALGITALVLGGLTWTASHWARADYPLSLEWLLRRLSRALARSGGPHQDSPSTSPAPDN